MIARHTLLAAAAAMFAAAAAGQPITEPAIAPAPPSLPRVALVTSAGTIVIALETVRAPLTSANFLRYVDQKRLDGTTFYRAVTFPSVPGFGLIQGGLRGDPKRSLKPVAHEATSQTGILHTDGTISMARAAPGTATADFFVTSGAITPHSMHNQAAIRALPPSVMSSKGWMSCGPFSPHLSRRPPATAP